MEKSQGHFAAALVIGPGDINHLEFINRGSRAFAGTHLPTALDQGLELG